MQPCTADPFSAPIAGKSYLSDHRQETWRNFSQQPVCWLDDVFLQAVFLRRAIIEIPVLSGAEGEVRHGLGSCTDQTYSFRPTACPGVPGEMRITPRPRLEALRLSDVS